MSDKRQLESASDAAAGEDGAKKRKVIDSLSDSGPLSQKDVVYFQKEAIYRQLVHYRTNASIVESDLRTYTKYYEEYKQKLLLLLTWVDQFAQLATAFVGGASDADIDSINFLLSIDIDSKSDDFLKELDAKKESLNSILNKLAKNQSSDYVEKSNSLIQSIEELKLQKIELTKQNQLITSKYDSLHTTYLDLIRTTERSNSKTLERVNGVKKEEAGQATEVKKEDTPANSTNSVNQDQLDELNLKLKEYSSTIDAQKSIIDDQLIKLTNLNDEISKLNKSSKSSIDVKNSNEYKELLSNYETLNIEHNEFLQKHDILQENFINLEKKSNALNDVLGNKFEDEKNKIVDQFSKLENDLIRIRTARDELLSQKSILESDKSRSTVIKELQDLLAEQSKIFESKTESDVANGNNDEDPETLKKKNTILTSELQSLEKAFHSLQSSQFSKIIKTIDYESQLAKYKVEKQKADQKYFAAMRSKDSLITEIKTLKDLVKNLEAKNATLEELKTFSQEEFNSLENALTNSNKLLILKQREIATLTKSITAIEMKLKASQLEVQTLQQSQSFNSEQLNTLLKSETELKLKLSKAQSQLSSTKQQLAKYKSQGSDAVNEEEVEHYRSMIYCTVCSIRRKDRVITSCGHIFCKACVDKRIETRSRRCPTCNHAFGNNDVLSVIL